MNERFLAFIDEQQLWSPHQRILLAISGGRDSVVLAHLLYQNKINFGLAHVNYHLRGASSDQDEAFVQELVTSWNLELHVHHEDLSSFEGNIQSHARSVRYDFFNRVAEDFDFDLIATAHHFDDRVESLFLNLMRGTGIHGMKGIPVKRDNIIRPLLWASREEINAYIKEHNLSFREDESNYSLNYQRNKLRHEVIPMLQAFDPQWKEKLGASLKWLSKDVNALDEKAHSFLHTNEEPTEINLKELPKTTGATWLYHCLREFGFTRAEAQQLWESDQSGSKVVHGAWTAQRQRDVITIVKLEPKQAIKAELNKPGSHSATNVGIIGVSSVQSDQVKFDSSNQRAFLHLEESDFPLTVRSLTDADRYQPLGLDYSVVLRKFLQEKDNSYGDWIQTLGVETAGGKLCWVVGLPVSEEFKIKEMDTEILCLYFDRNGD